MVASINLKQLKAAHNFPPQLHPAQIGYHVMLQLCMPKLTMVNYAKLVDVLMYIHIGVMGKLVNVKVVSQLANMHTATSPLLQF